jgi:hypothetical protein
VVAVPPLISLHTHLIIVAVLCMYSLSVQYVLYTMPDPNPDRWFIMEY